MSFKTNKDAAGNFPMERRIIRVDAMCDPAGITAALRRAFAAGPVPAAQTDEQDIFEALLKQIH